jgi:hypothetical protein
MEIGTLPRNSIFWEYLFQIFGIGSWHILVLGLLLAPVVHGEYILGDPAELHDDVVCV